jgi:hypothetical protein
MDEPANIVFDVDAMSTPSPRKPRARKSDTPPKDVRFQEPESEVYRPSSLDKPGRTPKEIKLIRDGLIQAFAFGGMALSMVNMYDGLVIGENAEKLADAWTKVAERNATFRKYLLKALSGGDLVGALMVTAAVLVPIAANHGLVDDDLVNLAATTGVKVPILLPAGSENGDGSSIT